MTTLLEREGSEFTRYPEYAVEYRDASHRYWLIRGQERIPAISVTSALKIIDKPQLVGWAERVGIEGLAKAVLDDVLIVSPEQAVNLVRSNGWGADGLRDSGADRGTAIHEALRLYCEAGDVPKLGNFDPAVRGYVQGLCRWLLATRPEPILVERVVGSALHGYAGRFDLLADIDGRKVLIDLKTSARPYVEQHMQIAAYMHALDECEGESGEHHADAGMILLVGLDGTFTAHDCCADPKHFLKVLACQRAVGQVRGALRTAERVMEAAVA